MIAATGGGFPVGAVMVAAGIILCFGSTGGTVTDIFNAYYWADAFPSIATAGVASPICTKPFFLNSCTALPRFSQ